MLTNRIRLLRILLRALPRRARPMTGHQLSFRVRLTDCDINMHMNNARYLSIMDLGRWDLTVRSGLLGEAFRRKLQPVVVDCDIRYRRELRPGHDYTLETRYAALEGRKLWFEQRFVRGETVHAEARVGILMLRDGKVAGREAVEGLLQALALELDRASDGKLVVLRTGLHA